MNENGAGGDERHVQVEAAMQAAYEKFSVEWPDNLGRFNVLVAGATGVGKSALVNEVFGATMAEEGVGRPQTMSIDRYCVPGKPVTILDTRGFELGTNEPHKLIGDEIKAMRRKPQEADHLHVAWLCLRQESARFEKYHEAFVAQMRKLGVPVIVILTNSLDAPGALESHIVSVVGLDVPVVNILARNRRIGPVDLPAHGLPDLMEATVALLPEGRRAAVIAAQVVSASLKDKEARKAIVAAAAAAVGAAMTPVPGADLIAIGGIQAALMARLDKLAGVENAGVMHYAKLAGAALARGGGTRLFAMVSAQVLKFIPGVGTAAGDAIAAGVAGTVTTALGFGYWTAAKLAARNGTAVDPDTVVRSYQDELSRAQKPKAEAA